MAGCIEIRIGDDGSLSVGWEDKPAEAAEGEEGENLRPVADIKEALTAVLEIYKQHSKEAIEAESEFSAGFGKGPQQGAMPVERGMME